MHPTIARERQAAASFSTACRAETPGSATLRCCLPPRPPRMLSRAAAALRTHQVDDALLEEVGGQVGGRLVCGVARQRGNHLRRRGRWRQAAVSGGGGRPHWPARSTRPSRRPNALTSRPRPLTATTFSLPAADTLHLLLRLLLCAAAAGLRVRALQSCAEPTRGVPHTAAHCIGAGASCACWQSLGWLFRVPALGSQVVAGQSVVPLGQ